MQFSWNILCPLVLAATKCSAQLPLEHIQLFCIWGNQTRVSWEQLHWPHNWKTLSVLPQLETPAVVLLQCSGHASTALSWCVCHDSLPQFEWLRKEHRKSHLCGESGQICTASKSMDQCTNIITDSSWNQAIFSFLTISLNPMRMEST